MMPVLKIPARMSVVSLLLRVTYSPKRLPVDARCSVPSTGDSADAFVFENMRATTAPDVPPAQVPRLPQTGRLMHSLPRKNPIAPALLNIPLLSSPIDFAVLTSDRRNMGLSVNMLVTLRPLPFGRVSYTPPNAIVVCRKPGPMAAARGHPYIRLLNIVVLPMPLVLHGRALQATLAAVTKLLTAIPLRLVAIGVTPLITLLLDCSLVGPQTVIRHACLLPLFSSRGSRPTSLLHLPSTPLMDPRLEMLAPITEVTSESPGGVSPLSCCALIPTLVWVRPMTFGTVAIVSRLMDPLPTEKLDSRPSRLTKLANGLLIRPFTVLSTACVVATLPLHVARLCRNAYRDPLSLLCSVCADAITLCVDALTPFLLL